MKIACPPVYPDKYLEAIKERRRIAIDSHSL